MEWVTGIVATLIGLAVGFLVARAFPGKAAATLRDEHTKATERSIQLDVTLAKEREALADKAARLEEASSQRDALRDELAGLRAEHATLREKLAQEMRQAEEKLALLAGAKDQMKLEFKALSEEVMKGHSATFAEQNKEQMTNLLTPLRERLGIFQQVLTAAHVDSAKERAALAEQIQRLTQTSATMLSETSNLTRALKGEAQTQGAWGEMILESILERSGLREGEEYVTQTSHSGPDGTRVRTDVIVRLPNGQRVIIDSKVSLTAFEAYCTAEADDHRAACLKAHLASVRTHIKGLSSKEYHAAAGSGLDYVIMFVPIEGALAAALQEDSALTAFAVDSNVPIATPTTLMIALRTIANLWQVERRNRNADAIADRAGKLYEKFAGFVADLQKLGGRIDQAKEAYDGAMGKLATGTGSLMRQVEQLKEMGAKTSKSLPAGLLSDGPEAPDAPARLPRPADAAE